MDADKQSAAAPGARPTMDDDREKVADMIEEAARKLGATIYWNQHARFGFLCSVTLDEYEVGVEAMPSKYGARIETPDGGRHWDYTNASLLTAAIRRRVRTMKAADAADAKRREEYAKREQASVDCRLAAKELLIGALGEEVYDACLMVGDWLQEKNGKWHVVATVNLHAGHIRGSKMSVAEAVKLVTVLRCAGYDLLKMCAADDAAR